MTDFIGVKIALLCGDSLVVIQRDNKPGLRFADMWDMPGGGREDNETPFECVAREIVEELGIKISQDSVVSEKAYPAIHDPTLTSYFMVATINLDTIAAIKFGNEGQGWKMMTIDDFMSDPKVIEALKERLADYLDKTQSS